MTKAPARKPARTEWRYSACGLGIAADAAIDGLGPVSESTSDPDVCVFLRHGVPIPPVDAAERIWHSSPYLDAAGLHVQVAARNQRDGSAWLRYSDGAAFRLDAAARQVDVWWEPPLTAVDAVTYL